MSLTLTPSRAAFRASIEEQAIGEGAAKLALSCGVQGHASGERPCFKPELIVRSSSRRG